MLQARPLSGHVIGLTQGIESSDGLVCIRAIFPAFWSADEGLLKIIYQTLGTFI
jgi:hypothetical protein